jgi:signal transduction histidine kinase
MEDITERKRAEQLLQALNRAASVMEGVLNPEEIFVAVAGELEQLGFHSLVFLAGEDKDKLYPRYLSYEAGALQVVEKLSGYRAVEFPISAKSVETFRQVVHERRTIFVEDVEDAARDLLPGPVKRLAGQVVSILRVSKVIAAPLIVEDEVVGILAVQSNDLTEDDEPAVTAFAHQMAAAWRRTQLYQELQRYAEQLEERVQERTVQLQTQYARLEAILASTVDGILVSDESGEIVRTNPVANAWLTQTLSLEDAERLRMTVRDLALRAEEGPEEILELTGLDLQLSAAPILEPGIEGSTAVVAVHDVSYLKAVDRLKSRFVSNVSHELRTPIATIKLLAALMRKQPDRWEEYLNPLEQEAERQAQLVEDILDISRIDVGRMEVEPRPLQLNELTDGTVMAHQLMAQNRGLVLEHRPAEPGPVALVDREQIMKVLNNLVENGLNYTPEGGRVIVSTGTEEAEGRVWATVTVTDTGIGIPSDEMPHVLERFFRGAEPREMQIPGTGLGLAIVNEIVELHGGRVTVESQVGEGSTVMVWLPHT